MKKRIKIKFYHSSFCPRCYLAKKILRQLEEEYKHIDIEYIDILKNSRCILQDKVFFIPALKTGANKVTLLMPNEVKIRSFLDQAGASIQTFT